eukprot:TRINITY_DN2393_c1_g1_i5.p1 TRINITY_DN2393_c1_g1~~TRINITY_DN2393_c1_g1_i5.p1  ORF type:complete len:484 (-),score=170.40 TRINITY_DN2393_c1_g1_i5:641-2092(-)
MARVNLKQGSAAHMHFIACLATETLRALERARGKHAAVPAPATSLALLELLQLCLRHATPQVSRDAAAATPPAQVPAEVAAAAPDLERCVRYLHLLLLKLLDEELNHFGTFKPSAFIADVALLQDELAVTLQRASQPPPSENRDLSLDPAAMAIRSFTTRAWWRRAFGERSAAAAAAPTQAQFRDAFVRCYGAQPAPALNLFLEALCDAEQQLQATPNEGSAQRSSSSSSARVSMRRFDALTHEHAGVYEAYQAVSDPGRLVYVMGVVGDDPHAVQSTPIVVTGLLGLKVSQVCCGGQHAAVLTESGDIYTWGRGGFGRLGQLYICGRNYKGQLGLGDPVLFQQNERGHHYQAHFQQLEDLSYERVTQISCGGEHSAVITQGGSTIYSFGAGHKGQLGHGNCMNEHRPRRVEALMSTHRTLLHVACGNNCTLVLAGNCVPPTLSELCMARVRTDSGLSRQLTDMDLMLNVTPAHRAESSPMSL